MISSSQKKFTAFKKIILDQGQKSFNVNSRETALLMGKPQRTTRYSGFCSGKVQDERPPNDKDIARKQLDFVAQRKISTKVSFSC